MASGPITSWEIDGETMETVTDFIFVGSKITADGDCSHETKRHFLLSRKAMTNLNSILKKQRHYFTNKDSYNQNYVFSSLTLCNHIDGSPPGSPVRGILQARTLEWLAISFSNA